MRCGQSPNAIVVYCSKGLPTSFKQFVSSEFYSSAWIKQIYFPCREFHTKYKCKYKIQIQMRLVGLDSLFVRASSKKLHSLFVGTFRTLGQITSATLAINYRSQPCSTGSPSYFETRVNSSVISISASQHNYMYYSDKAQELRQSGVTIPP